MLFENTGSSLPTASDLEDWKSTTGVDDPVVAALDRDWIDPVWGSDGSGAAAGMVLLAPGMVIEKISRTWGAMIEADEVEPLIPG